MHQTLVKEILLIKIESVQPEEILWLFPNEITNKQSNNLFLGQLPQYSDISPGALEDEWFLTAIAFLAERKSIVSKLTQAISLQDTFTHDIWNELWSSIIPPMFHVYAKKGLFVFRFMKDYKYRYVIIDGKLPCGKNKVPVFAQLQSSNAF